MAELRARIQRVLQGHDVRIPGDSNLSHEAISGGEEITAEEYAKL
jgi:hypothetical protein